MTHEEFFEYLQPECIAILKTGSCLFNLDNCRDEDFVCLVKDDTDWETAEAKLISLIEKEGISYDYHIRTINRLMPTAGLIFQILSEHIIGENVKELADIDILTNYKDEYIKILRNSVRQALNVETQTPYHPAKGWYYILLGIYFLINNKYELTPEQKIVVQRAHDRQATQEDKDFCIHYLYPEYEKSGN